MKERGKLIKILKAGDSMARLCREMIDDSDNFSVLMIHASNSIEKWKKLRSEMESIDD